MQVCINALPAPCSGLPDGIARLPSFILFLYSLHLQETKLVPPEHEFIESSNIPAEKASGRGTKMKGMCTTKHQYSQEY